MGFGSNQAPLSILDPQEALSEVQNPPFLYPCKRVPFHLLQKMFLFPPSWYHYRKYHKCSSRRLKQMEETVLAFWPIPKGCVFLGDPPKVVSVFAVCFPLKTNQLQMSFQAPPKMFGFFLVFLCKTKQKGTSTPKRTLEGEVGGFAERGLLVIDSRGIGFASPCGNRLGACQPAECFHLLKTCVLFLAVGFKGNLSLLDVCFCPGT